MNHMDPPSTPLLVEPPSPWRLVALVIGAVAELLLLGSLALAAWGPYESYAGLSVGDGLLALAVFGGMGTVLVITGAALITTGRWWGAIVATILMILAGLIGFFGCLLAGISRQELEEH